MPHLLYCNPEGDPRWKLINNSPSSASMVLARMFFIDVNSTWMCTLKGVVIVVVVVVFVVVVVVVVGMKRYGMKRYGMKRNETN